MTQTNPLVGQSSLLRGAAHCARPVVDPKVRLFLFHHVGGSRVLFHGWDDRFPTAWEVFSVDAPGRGRLHDVAPRDSVGALVEFLRSELLPLMDRPFALFGHSMGALVAYELVRQIEAEKGPQPVWLGISACDVSSKSAAGGSRADFSDEELQAWLARAGGTPLEVVRHPLTWGTLSRLVRSDLRVVESWRPQEGAQPVSSALSVFGGRADALVRPERLMDWAPLTRRFQGRHLYDGGHFYLQGNTQPVIRQITDSVADALTNLSNESTSFACSNSLDSFR
ncbi:thioesterase II family protein [Streptomyces sp. NPDC054765]